MTTRGAERESPGLAAGRSRGRRRPRQQMTSRRRLAGQRGGAAGAPSSQPSRLGPAEPGGAQEDEHGERAEQREQRLRMEEDAHPVDDRIGGDEGARGDRPADMLRPDLAGDQARGERQAGAAGECDQLARRPRLRLRERDRLVEPPERAETERGGPAIRSPRRGRGERDHAGGDEREAEPARRRVPRQLERRPTGAAATSCSAPIASSMEERRRRILVVLGLRRDAAVRVQVLRVGEVLARVDRRRRARPW